MSAVKEALLRLGDIEPVPESAIRSLEIQVDFERSRDELDDGQWGALAEVVEACKQLNLTLEEANRKLRGYDMDRCPHCGETFLQQWPELQPDGSIKTLGVVTFTHTKNNKCTVAAHLVPWLNERPARTGPKQVGGTSQ
jgi:hypothetical protein